MFHCHKCVCLHYIFSTEHTFSLMPGFLSEYFWGSSFSILWIFPEFPPMWHLNSGTVLLPCGLMLPPPGSIFLSQRLYWTLAASICSCWRGSPGDPDHTHRSYKFIGARDSYSSQEGWMFTRHFLFDADTIEIPPTPNLFSSVVWECITQQPRLILAQIFSIWSFNQNISILAFNTT